MDPNPVGVAPAPPTEPSNLNMVTMDHLQPQPPFAAPQTLGNDGNISATSMQHFAVPQSAAAAGFVLSGEASQI
ncbi:hypothetical protein Ndes2437B_g00574 [Nannochloris sp. 'desiccata']